MIRQFELVETVKSYDRLADEDALNRAYVFSMKAHGNQKRASGDPYFLHPLEVAGILTEYKLDTSSIITALLHDTIEDTDVTSNEVSEQFGEEVAQLVEGVTKLTQIELQSQQTDQAENFRKLVLAMSEDIRVLLVKLADRLHNMRTLGYIDNEAKRRRIALETMEIYAPLAERIGMQELKSELEDLSFAELNPEARDSIIARLQFLRDQGRDNVDVIIEELTETMRARKLRATVIGREKSPYSIWRKTQKKNISFEQVADIIAFRILVENADDCYRALGIMHGAYPTVPGRFKDYISTPKSNGYQSIHTCVIGPNKQRIEIQIRTQDMHEVAELGVAAHWQYKHGLDRTHGREYRWLRELLDILDHDASPDDFLEHTKLEMFTDQVFCFTPAGEVIALPGGATPVDFAYAVHSEIGETCVGAKINGRSMPLRTELENGDQVEIITSAAQTPSPLWENFVVTGKARSHIRRFIRLRQKEEYMALGRAILERAFKQEEYEFNEESLEHVLAVFSAPSTDDLAAEVGAGQITGRQVLEAVYPGVNESRRNGKVIQLVKAMNLRRPKKNDGEDGIPIKGLIPGMALHFAGCCSALPGDRIVGIVTKGRGVTIHTIDCETLEEFADMPERWIDVSWDQEAIDDYHVGRVELVVTNETGSLGELSTVIARNDGNISNLKITNRTPEFFDIMIDIQVRDVKHLTNIIAALRASPVINSVERARG
ncbi:MAG: bifunctional (p)ppGpp synthetase/guanosine-3',5'-bis(diphosphate) 3'-pyrophosphohydrolase [Rhodospirillales bacterium]|nr:bifunctional (p)ppGpp synthetase/guanosine-3',5'-bis(diphosphate) 3'-pyrophosphohydrolase [Rhodospirillaceae bacterium]MDP6430079.1 bifunctional (p)ppGpp synthetase/guanosine-3',5'-bis(diphosphate) 3'-pyrophosphohydrolase [Rhodospirillales bacterium]MDP6643107.1 bifunctional (p)ppGpp synthetase/guanosine-3',5'-bis(diphosphate) 3'-pyrophosphohydrolase [Rhodospirillales bacterium]MDP6842972.1 bifunctional (p)ppGpp synthetase/guanosine-3',5'-bis(diphosphate) 3'-pyrophosphohydrolase [Rhodospirill